MMENDPSYILPDTCDLVTIIGVDFLECLQIHSELFNDDAIYLDALSLFYRYALCIPNEFKSFSLFTISLLHLESEIEDFLSNCSFKTNFRHFYFANFDEYLVLPFEAQMLTKQLIYIGLIHCPFCPRFDSHIHTASNVEFNYSDFTYNGYDLNLGLKYRTIRLAFLHEIRVQQPVIEDPFSFQTVIIPQDDERHLIYSPHCLFIYRHFDWTFGPVTPYCQYFESTCVYIFKPSGDECRHDLVRYIFDSDGNIIVGEWYEKLQFRRGSAHVIEYIYDVLHPRLVTRLYADTCLLQHQMLCRRSHFYDDRNNHMCQMTESCA